MENGTNPELCPICQKELGTKVKQNSVTEDYDITVSRSLHL